MKIVLEEFMALDKKFKKKWIKALRSGKYKQGTSVLRSTEKKLNKVKVVDTFCCLGVACDLINPKGWRFYNLETDDESGWKYRVVDSLGRKNPSLSQEEKECLLPTQVAEKIGLTKEAENTLAELNDWCGYSFDSIADYIEKNL